MNVNSASSTSNLWHSLQASQAASANATVPSDASTGSSSITGSSTDGSKLSGPGQLFSALENLSKSNPVEFKKITSQVASQLQQVAKDSKDPGQAQALSQLAMAFQTASQSGNFSDLFSQSQNTATGIPSNASAKAAGHPHHSHYDGDADDSSAASSSSTALSSIFSNALSQIATDLKPTSTQAVK